MENKMVRVPFAVEIAKKITNGEVNGNIVTRDGRNARVICWDKKSDSIYNIVALLDEKIMERILTYTINGSEAEGIEFDCKSQSFYCGFNNSTNSKIWLGRTPREAYAELIDKVSGKGTWESINSKTIHNIAVF